MAGDGFTYSGSSVLKNRENIVDDIIFEHWLSERTQTRSLQLYFMPPPAEFNSNYLKEIHRHIFQDAFEWAGHKLDFSLVTAERMTLVSIAASERGDLAPMKHMFEDISNPQKQHILKEFLTAMRKNGMDVNYRNVVAAQEGISYTGKFVGGGPDGFAMTIDNRDIVIGKRSDLSQEQRIGLNQNDSFTFSPAVYLIPSRPPVSLSPERLSEQVSNFSGVRACREEIEHLSRLVYGRSNVLEKELVAIGRDLRDWEGVKKQIETDPASIAPLAGKEKLFGKDQTRKNAETHLSRLGQAIENYADASRQARHEIMERHEAEQRRLGQSVDIPNRDIHNILSLPKERQLEVLAKSPELQKQLDAYMNKIDARLSSAEHRAISQGDTAQLAKSLNVSQTQAKAVTETVNQVRAAHAQLSESRYLSQQQGITRTTPSPIRGR